MRFADRYYLGKIAPKSKDTPDDTLLNESARDHNAAQSGGARGCCKQRLMWSTSKLGPRYLRSKS